MSGTRTKIILHIGQHKTGSKALQSFLAHYAGGLEERGILYPVEEQPRHRIRAYAISHYRMFALLRKEAMEACRERNAAADFWAKQRGFCEPFESLHGMFESLEAGRARIGAEAILLSAEDLFDMHSAHESEFSTERIRAGVKILARLVDEFRYDPTVVVYLRRQDHLLGAHYVQYIKGSLVNDVDFEEFAKTFAPRFHTRDILAPWSEAFGTPKILVRPYESMSLPSGIVPDFFEHALGFFVPAGWAPPPKDVESANVTPDRDHVEFIRILNRKKAKGLPVFPREDVLEAALVENVNHGPGAGIAAWLTPKLRREFLGLHAQGNAEIAAHFLGAGKSLFSEPLPSDENWREYSGLSAERVAALTQKIEETVSRRTALKSLAINSGSAKFGA